MDTQQMKVAALQDALNKEDHCASTFAPNFNNSWRLQCSCYKLTQFGFYLQSANGVRAGEISWFPHCEITEKEAKAFLYGLGNPI